MSEIPDLLERFRRGAELVAVSITGEAGSEVDFIPEPEKWSIRQIVAHLCDAEIVATMRLRQILAEEDPCRPGIRMSWAKNLDYARRKPSQSLRNLPAHSQRVLRTDQRLA